MYFKDAMAALIVYDVTDERSFEKARKWVKELNEMTGAITSNGQQKIVKYLVGNKCDQTED